MEARVDAQEVTITVHDTGRGVSADVLPRVLQMAGNPINPLGSAIGLSIARRIVELHGGTIALKSDGAGRGTGAVVTLPLMNYE